MLDNIPQSVTDIKYLLKVIKKEYGENKNYNKFKENLLKDLNKLMLENPPVLITIFLSHYMLKTKYDRKILLNNVMINKNLKISYIIYDNENIFTSHR
jgi:hypothetical protein